MKAKKNIKSLKNKEFLSFSEFALVLNVNRSTVTRYYSKELLIVTKKRNKTKVVVKESAKKLLNNSAGRRSPKQIELLSQLAGIENTESNKFLLSKQKESLPKPLADKKTTITKEKKILAKTLEETSAENKEISEYAAEKIKYQTLTKKLKQDLLMGRSTDIATATIQQQKEFLKVRKLLINAVDNLSSRLPSLNKKQAVQAINQMINEVKEAVE